MRALTHRLASSGFGSAPDGLSLRVPARKSWTGRSLVSSATDTLVSRAISCTTHRTRVSEMRLQASDSLQQQSKNTQGIWNIVSNHKRRSRPQPGNTGG